MANLSLSLIEIIVLMAGAITLGITIHFFITSRKTLMASPYETQKVSRNMEDWKLRYLNELEKKEQELKAMEKKLAEAEENNRIIQIEVDEIKWESKKLRAVPPSSTQEEKPDYIRQLQLAQSSLQEQNEKINELLGQIDFVKEAQEKQEESRRLTDELADQVYDLKNLLSDKEKELEEIRQKSRLTREMTSMLDNAYNEFNVLQEKMQKLEGQAGASRRITMEYEDLKEAYYKVSRDLEELRLKYNEVISENQQMELELRETEDKLREANFQRQQLQKRVTCLEEINNDMLMVAEANKKLEGQLKRIGELESMLNVVAEERDELARKQYNG